MSWFVQWVKEMGSLERMKQRASYNGYDLHDKQIVEGKYKSFLSALRMSYQAENITLDKDGTKCRCLINPDKLKEDYDQKEISIDFKYGLAVGDTFYWDRTDTHWLVYLQEFAEEAYFRSSIRRCNYKIDDDWIYLRGPKETELVWNQKHQVEFNDLNYTILFYVTKTEANCEKYSRFKVIKFDGHNWRVAAVDRYSQPGLLEVYLEEYYDNSMEDAAVVPEIVEPDTMKPYIDGPQQVRPYDSNLTFSIVGKAGGSFVVNSNKVEIVESNESSCVVNITTGRAGEFTISYQKSGEEDVTLDVLIKSL